MFVDGNDLISLFKYLLRREASQAAVMVFVVISIEVRFTPGPGVANVIEATRIVWLIFLGFKLTLTEGIVMAYTGSAMAAGHIQRFHVVEIAEGNHE